MFYIYILQSIRNKSFYIGSCADVNVRLAQHNKGRVRSTKRYIPWEIIYTEEFVDLKSARQREKQIKSWKKRSIIENLIKHRKI